MTHRPILFSGPMVRALLDGRKTQTRRVLKLPRKTCSGGPIYERKDMGGWEPTTNGGGGCFTIAKDGSRVPEPEKVGIWHRTTGVCLNAPYQAGDRLWVRETLQAASNDQGTRWLAYAADGEDVWPLTEWHKARNSVPSIHMPRWASRLTLTVTDVRVQRLQEISEADARAEGVLWVPGHGEITPADLHEGYSNYLNCREGFQVLWDGINAKRGFGWDANPWIVVLTFSVERRNIDEVQS